MTEDEARQKRCCGPEGCGYPNGLDTVLAAESTIEIPTRYCIASECMAWRCSEVWTGKEEADGHPMDTTKDSNTHGYCGLAR